MTTKLLTPIITYLLYINLRSLDSNKVITSISYSFFSIALGFLLAWIIGDFGAYFPDIISDSMMGWAISKVGEAIPICTTIFFLVIRKGESFNSLGFTGGKIFTSIGYGLTASILGIVQYIAMVGVTVPFSISQLLLWFPWLLLFAFSNSILEELIFRGLFLRKYSLIFGKKGALLLISFVFAIFHAVLLPFMGFQMVIVFMLFLFLQGYVWGYILQKTESIWGSIIAHTIADILFLLATFSST